MLLYPKLYLKRITDLSPKYLKEKNIKGLILDVDNTLLDFDLKFIDNIEQWHNNIQKNGIKTIILSNTNKKYKVELAAKKLNIDYILFAMKPRKKGFMEAKEKLGLKEEQIASIGDQIFTDVLGANKCNMFSILVEPLGKKDIFITRFKRPIEKIVIKKYLKKLKKEEKNVYK